VFSPIPQKLCIGHFASNYFIEDIIMNTLTKGLSLVALIAAVNVATAGEPIELASADLDQITAGALYAPNTRHNAPSVSFSAVVGPSALAIGRTTLANASFANAVTNGSSMAATESAGLAVASGPFGAVSYVNTGSAVSMLTH
jgi:hypothetical protein